MLVACLCCTYGRPRLLAEAIESFLRQTYEPKELIILDDAGQYRDVHVPWPGVKLVSLPYRFRTLGEKRNTSAAIASAKAEVYAIWDDDDIYLPNHLAVGMELIRECEWVIPAMVGTWDGNMLRKKANTWLFHGGWLFRRSLFQRVGGYPIMQTGQDQALATRFKRDRAVVTRHTELTYIYRWGGTGSPHLSALPKGDLGYQVFHSRVDLAPVSEIQPAWSRDWVAEAAKLAGRHGQESDNAET
jgi:glycosyltransferase involved in cell wall biosynthesis